MNSHSASFNFPPGFLWGIVPYDGFVSDKENFPYIFDLQEKQIKSVLINIPWAACEPLKGHYDEEYIETLRTLLVRIQGRNISPVVILNTKELPAWQNLDHPKKRDRNDIYNFAVHIAEALCPYTKFFGLISPKGSLFEQSRLNSETELLNDIISRIHELSESAKTVLVLNSLLLAKDEWLDRIRYRFIGKISADYLGVEADENAFKTIMSLFGGDHKPIMVLTDSLKTVPPDKRSEILADKLYSVWRFYQSGWPVSAFFSETAITERSDDSLLYENSSINNAFIISDDLPYLPVKWQQFLKD